MAQAKTVQTMKSQDENVQSLPVRSPYDCSTAETYTPCKLPKSMPEWWMDNREAAFSRFKAQGLPTPKMERFKYTNLARAVKDWDGVLGDGKASVQNDQGYVRSLADCMDVDWVRAALQNDAPGAEKYKDSALWDLNSAYLRDGFVIDIPAGIRVEMPITILHQGMDDNYTSSRLIIRVQENAELALEENQNGEGEYWKNFVTDIELKQGAKMVHLRLQDETLESVESQYTRVRAGKDASYYAFSLNMGGALTRYQAHAELTGPGAHVSFDGLHLLEGSQHSDTTILVEHQAPHCTSNQFYRNLIADKAHGVFQGKVHVYEDAQKTDGYQLSNTLLLSEQAHMDTKPELEIYADDVQCSHGATTGQIDEEPLFYLRSRGLSEMQARRLLVEAFIAEVMDKAQDGDLKTIMESKVGAWLSNVLK